MADAGEDRNFNGDFENPPIRDILSNRRIAPIREGVGTDNKIAITVARRFLIIISPCLRLRKKVET
jgi:hypothetical protein